jgi:hypothetical protein
MKRIAFAAAVIAALVGSTAALAEEAEVKRDSDVYRTRTSSTVIYTVDRGDIVEVLRCRSQRCEIDVDGESRNGWIRQNRLAPIDDEGDSREEIPFQFGLVFGPSGPGISVGIGGDGDSGVSVDLGGGVTSGPRVCLYDLVNYGGAARCFGEGETVNNLQSVGWNDAAESVRVYGGAGAQVCEHAGGGGACFNVNTNTANLGGSSNMLSYIDVY